MERGAGDSLAMASQAVCLHLRVEGVTARGVPALFNTLNDPVGKVWSSALSHKSKVLQVFAQKHSCQDLNYHLKLRPSNSLY